MSFCKLLGLPEITTPEALQAAELQASLLARSPVSIPFQVWAEFSPQERLIVAEACEKHRIDLAMVQGAASRSADEAAAAYAAVDGGQSALRAGLRRMAQEALA